VLHLGVVQAGSISVGDKLTCLVDYERRELVVPNHTLTVKWSCLFPPSLISALG
jgi:alanyl-tRNA synthetase